MEEEVDYKKQQELGLQFAEILKDTKPMDALMALAKTTYIVLRSITLPDEKGIKTGRMRIMWLQLFEALVKDME
jgi:hypothetical protein